MSRREAARRTDNAPDASIASRIERLPVWALVLAPVLLHLILALLVLQPSPYMGGDNATYVALAHSIVERGTYTEIWDPFLRPATLYPPVFPLMLAGVIALGANSWLAFKLLSIFISGVAVAFSALWLRRVLKPGAAFGAALFVAISPGILEQTHLVLSEIPFWGFTMLALWAITHVSTDNETHDARWIAIAAVAATLAWLTRSAGLPLLLAIGIWLLWRRRWRMLAIMSGIALPVMLAWIVRGRMLGAHGYGSYLLYVDPYQPALGRINVFQLVPRAFINAGHYFSNLAPKALLGAAPMATALGMLVLTVALGCWLVRLVREPGVLEIWVLLYLGVVLIWPRTWAGERFVLVLIPAFILFVLDAWRQFTLRVGENIRPLGLFSGLIVALVALISVSQQITQGFDCRSRARNGEAISCMQDDIRDVLLVGMDARGKLPPHSVVISRKPTLFFLMSGYQSIIYPYQQNPDSFFAAARKAHARYVVVDNTNLAPLFLYPALRSNPARFCSSKTLSRDQAIFMRIDTTANVPGAPATGDYVHINDCVLPL